MKMPPKEQAGGEYSPTVSSFTRLIEKASGLAKRMIFFCTGFALLDGFINLTYFQIRKTRYSKAARFCAGNTEEPSRALRSFDDLSLSSKKKIRCAQLKPKFFHG
jgi:hypothetical protein